MKIKEVDANKCGKCGKVFEHSASQLPQERGRCVFAQCADCFLGKNEHAVALGTLGGKSKTAAKVKASRLNGKLGGRKRKSPPDKE